MVYSKMITAREAYNITESVRIREHKELIQRVSDQIKQVAESGNDKELIEFNTNKELVFMQKVLTDAGFTTSEITSPPRSLHVRWGRP